MTNGNDEAFARPCGSIQSEDYDTGAPGMSKREYFAAMAMQGMMGRDVYDAGQATPAQRASLACIEADALIAALNVPTCPQCKLPTADNHYDKEHDICSITERCLSEAV
jgi:hypothetical protein